MTEKRFTSCGNNIERDGKLLNIEFKTKTDAKLCCKLCNQMDKYQQEYIDELNDIFKWYKEYYGETILDTRMGWNDNDKISKLEKENEDLKEKLESLEEIINNQIYEVKHTHENCKKVGIAELKKLKKVLICNNIIQDGDVE